MTAPEPYRYILIELEQPLDLGDPPRLGMLCPTPENVGLTFVSGDRAARAVRFTPVRTNQELPDRAVVVELIERMVAMVVQNAWRTDADATDEEQALHVARRGFDPDWTAATEAGEALMTLLYGEDA